MDTINSSGSGNWGHCQDCRWWQHNQDAHADPAAVGRCDQPENMPIELQVSAQSGCNHFSPRMAHAMAGAGAA
jgi:hypothetical protein